MNQLEPQTNTALQHQDTNLPVDISWQDLQVALTGNLAKLSPEGQVKYYNALCKFTGLNPLGFPFAWITFQGKLVLYAKKECADQLCGLRKISIKIIERQFMDDIYIVRAHATMPNGQETEASGAVPFKGLNADAKCIAIKKCETQAKRRAVLSLVGLGIMDQDEVAAPTIQTTVDSAQEESTFARAERLNAQLTAGEKSSAIPISETAPVVAQAASQEAPLDVAAEPSGPVPTAATIQAPAATIQPQVGSPAGLPALLSEDEVRNLEIALGGHKQPQKCVAYMEFKGAKKKGAGMETLRRNWFTLIIAKPQNFFDKVDAWLKEGK